MQLANLHEPQRTLHCWRCRAKLPCWIKQAAYADGSLYHQLWRAPGLISETTRHGTIWRLSRRNQDSYNRSHAALTTQKHSPAEVAQLRARMEPTSRRGYINPALASSWDEIASLAISPDTPIPRPEAATPIDMNELPMYVECPVPGCKVPNRLEAAPFGVDYNEQREMDIFDRISREAVD